MTPKQESQARAIVNKLPRPDLEDKYLRSQEENIILKRHVRKQEDKIKRFYINYISAMYLIETDTCNYDQNINKADSTRQR